MSKKIIVGIFLSLCCFNVTLFAEETPSPQERSPRIRGPQTLDPNSNAWEESILNLRDSAETLIQDHDKLITESEALKKKLFGLSDSIKETDEQKKRLILEPERLTKLIQESEVNNNSLQSQIKALEKELVNLEKSNASLKKELTRLDTQLNPRNQEIDRFRQKKVDIDLELELLAKVIDTPQIQELKKDIESVKESVSNQQQKEQELKETLEEEQKKYTVLLDDIQLLKKENQKLSSDLTQAQRATRVFSDDAAHLKKQSPDEQLFGRKLLEKKNLEENIARLEAKMEQLQKLSQNPVEAMSNMEESEKEFVQRLNELKDKNQNLSENVAQLRIAASELKRENAMMNALLDVQKTQKIARDAGVDFGTPEAMAYAYASQGMYEEAIEKYQQAIEEGVPHKHNIYFNLGYVYYQMSNIPEAINSYKNALKADPSDEEAKRNILKLKQELKKKGPQNPS